jgi:phasin family protein
MSIKSPFDIDFQKIIADLKIPGIDVDSVIAAQKKNIDAITHANKVAYEGLQALVKRQTEIVREAVEAATAAAHKVKDAESPAAKLSTQAELAKEAFEHGIANAKELADLVAKSNGEVIGLLNTRFTQSIDEFKSLVNKATTVATNVYEHATHSVAPAAPEAPAAEASVAEAAVAGEEAEAAVVKAAAPRARKAPAAK